MAKSEQIIFYKDVDREKVWELYLNSFKPETRQEYNCNCCKSFLRQFSGIVFIKDGYNVESIWDIDLQKVDNEYYSSINALKEYINSLPITNVFLSSTKKFGTNQNFDKIKNIIWEHFSISASDIKIVEEDDIASKQSEYRSTKEVFKRALEELSVDSINTVLDLIAQNSLYRGKEFEKTLKDFLKFKKEYIVLTSEQAKDAYAWKNSTIKGVPTNIRNSSIGTLLINLSEEMELDLAVTKYEKVVAPENYKRPTSLITKGMIDQARKKIEELGFIDSLERRFANETDLDINDLLFIDKSSGLTDIFKDLSKEVLVNPKTFSKVEEVTIQEFIENILPTVKQVEVLLEQEHFPNFFSLLTSVNKNSPSMFKYNNPFSIAYTGGVADSIKEKVKKAGGTVEGELRISLNWFNFDDLDLHVIEPNKNRIYYGAKRSPVSLGFLDVDMNAGTGTSRSAVENIIFEHKQRMLEGEYTVIVNNFSRRETIDCGYAIEVECNGVLANFESKTSPSSGNSDVVIKFNYDKKNGIAINGESKQKVFSKEKWALKTNQFIKVKSIMLSPNYWKNGSGNKHFLFLLEGCVNDEKVRPFFNEFLKQELNDHRKVFEVMASKLEVPFTANQLSGLGFSSTKENKLILSITGSFKRTIKIKF